jgi:hypothetical protein
MIKEKQEFQKTEYLSEGLRLTILGCFRYSLGRRTYMPTHTVGIIKQHPDIFTEQDWKRFIEEIDECEDLGDDCDINTWNSLKYFAKERLNEVKLRSSSPK